MSSVVRGVLGRALQVYRPALIRLQLANEQKTSDANPNEDLVEMARGKSMGNECYMTWCIGCSMRRRSARRVEQDVYPNYLD